MKDETRAKFLNLTQAMVGKPPPPPTPPAITDPLLLGRSGSMSTPESALDAPARSSASGNGLAGSSSWVAGSSGSGALPAGHTWADKAAAGAPPPLAAQQQQPVLPPPPADVQEWPELGGVSGLGTSASGNWQQADLESAPTGGTTMAAQVAKAALLEDEGTANGKAAAATSGAGAKGKEAGTKKKLASLSSPGKVRSNSSSKADLTDGEASTSSSTTAADISSHVVDSAAAASSHQSVSSSQQAQQQDHGTYVQPQAMHADQQQQQQGFMYAAPQQEEPGPVTGVKSGAKGPPPGFGGATISNGAVKKKVRD